MKLKVFSLIILVSLIFISCSKEEINEMAGNESQIAANTDLQLYQPEETVVSKLNEELAAIDDFIFTYNGIVNKMFKSSVNYDVRTLSDIQYTLENIQDKDEFESIMDEYYSISTSELRYLEEKRLALNEYIDVNNDETAKILFEKRFNQLINNGSLDISYIELIDSDGSTLRIPCWQVALSGIGGGALIAAGSAVTGNIFGGYMV